MRCVSHSLGVCRGRFPGSDHGPRADKERQSNTRSQFSLTYRYAPLLPTEIQPSIAQVLLDYPGLLSGRDTAQLILDVSARGLDSLLVPPSPFALLVSGSSAGEYELLDVDVRCMVMNSRAVRLALMRIGVRIPLMI